MISPVGGRGSWDMSSRKSIVLPGHFASPRHGARSLQPGVRGRGESMERVNGLHHITAIAGPAQENLDFYAGVLGMRLVKKSVNQDDPGTYHFFFADAEGHPRSDLTFFPWPQLAPPRLGHGLAVEVGLVLPPANLRFSGH